MLTKRPLKIFVDGYLLNKEYQGTKTYLKELYKEFSVKNKDISIFIGCFEDAEIIKEFESYTNINWIFYKSTNRFIRMFFELPKLIKEHNFHYAHFQYLIPFVRNKSTKYITTIHDIIFNDYKDQFSFSYRIVRNFLFKYSARKTDLLLTVSDYSKERIKNVYKIDNKPIYVVANAVSKDYFEPYDKNVSKDYISNKYGIGRFVLYVSRIEPRKNHHKLLKIFFDLKLEDIALVLIGNSSINNAEFSKYVNELTDDQKKLFFHLKNISLGKNSTIGKCTIIDGYAKEKVYLGDNSKIGPYSEVRCTSHFSKYGKGFVMGNNSGIGKFAFFGSAGGISIGDNVIMGEYVSFHSENHNFSDTSKLIREQGVESKGIFLGNDIWVGAKVTFLDGSHIGDHCVIAAGAVVTGKFPNNVVIGGVPAKVIKEL